MAKTVQRPDFDTQLAKFTPRQMEAVGLLDSGLYKYLLYGGALGGGKSYFIRWYSARRHLVLASWGFKNTVSMIACEDYPSLKDRQLSKISKEFPSWLGKNHSDHRDYGRCFILHERWGGGVICFRNLDDPAKYASAEFCLICVDELTKNDYDVFTFLRTRLRWPGLDDRETQFVAGTNPGSIGHNWVKQLWIDGAFGREWREPIDYTGTFAYVPSKATDNPYLDQHYYNILSTLPENLRGAFRDGDWNVFVGQAFPEFKDKTHVIDNAPVPEGSPIYMTYDWGFGKPFSIGWWYVDADGRVIRFREWYGWNDIPNQGLRITDPEVAKGIKRREKEWEIVDRVMRYSGHDCFQRKPDFQGGGQGPSTAETFQEHGLTLIKADSWRQLKIRAFRDRLRVPEDGTRPMLQVMKRCKHFIRTIGNLTMDPKNIEDVDTETEDHVYDEACHICMARPIIPEPKPTVLSVGESDFSRIQGEEPMGEAHSYILDDYYSDDFGGEGQWIEP
jgi:hypothetical protein